MSKKQKTNLNPRRKMKHQDICMTGPCDTKEFLLRSLIKAKSSESSHTHIITWNRTCQFVNSSQLSKVKINHFRDKTFVVQICDNFMMF